MVIGSIILVFFVLDITLLFVNVNYMLRTVQSEHSCCPVQPEQLKIR